MREDTLATSDRRVAYLVNAYPKVSHTFIRREILALEAQGWTVLRHAVRGSTDALPDATDRQEQARTRYLLGDGVRGLLTAGLAEFLHQPLPWLNTLRAALQRARGARRGRLYHLAYFLEGCRLARQLRADGCRHLHVHFATNSADVGLIACELAGASFSFTVHGPEEFDRPETLALAAKTRAARFVATVSQFGRSQMMRWVPLELWERLQVVRCGLDAAFTAAPLTPPPATPQLVCVGRLCEQKGQLLLLDAVAAVLASGRRMALVLAGDGEMRAEIEARVRALRLDDAVRITGWVGSEEVQRLILAARALVLPSFAEGLPIVLMEAMAMGRPVISTYVAGIPELVQDRSTGWLVPAGDVAALAQALCAALDSTPEELAAMGAAGRAQVLRLHTVEQQARELGQLFAACLTPAAQRASPAATPAPERLSGSGAS